MKAISRASLLLGGMASVFAVTSCNKVWDHVKDWDGTKPNPVVQLKNHSATPSFVKMMPGFEEAEIFTLIGSDDQLAASPSFIYGAQPDGAGLLRDPNSDGYVMINNHEILRGVSRVFLDKSFKPVKGEYIVDGDGGQWRLCSATMATPEEHGFGPLFLTAGESGSESRIHAINPFGSAEDRKRTDRVVPALGRASMENAVPLPKDAFKGRTVIVIGEDDGNGQVLLYVSNSVGDLENGQLYMLKRTNNDPIETNMELGSSYDVEFVPVDNHTTATGVEIAAQSVAKNAIQFARVEDLDYRKGGGSKSREIFFVATGVNGQSTKTKWGRLYQLKLDANNPLKGSLRAVADGGTDPGNDLINPDNVCVTDNFVYIQEDGDSYYPEAKHDSWIWQYDIRSGKYKPWMTMDHRRDDATFNAKYNTTNNMRFGSWEFGAMIDISETIGSPNTFLVNIHPHTWQDEKFRNADGSTVSGNKEGGQTIIVRGVQK
ncbi:hypothetical protein [Flavihumibacter sp. ZG627]|uniref:hypothetical protein n=1 Tax=Flavihumibacter sp. ZG627 TaxID=1463156 RepID=UPI00057E7EC1|nr:hypothetical protein [Flavihumibacter sp. ZG627]KIC92073.1 hypothetical protein HY58_00420 [Flavihumibacter sp. ZG627]